MRSYGLEIVAKAGVYSKQTSATGTAWVQLATAGTVRCNQVTIYNTTGTTLSVSYCATDGTALTGQASIALADGKELRLRGIQDAAQIRIQRADTSNTQVTASFLAEGVASV